ncbi:hypothetical protein F3U74_21670 [Salmonella enterica]|nr:hypothetical protein [Salmonella enterica]
MAKDRLLAEMAKGITPTNQLNGPQNRAEFHAGMYTAAKGSDTIEVAYLNGVDEPYIDQQEGFTVDGVTTKVRIDAGVAPVDYRGMVKCTV